MNLYCTQSEQVEAVVREEINRRDLLHEIPRMGIAVSGGADSLALLLLLHPICQERQIVPVVLTVDHGREGETEACAFVASVAERLGIPFFTRKGDVNTRVHSGESIEQAARELRMTFLKEMAEENHLDAIATGHHADDVAETVFLRLCRGAGMAGLAGLRARSQNGYVTVVRPLLRISHAALCAWLRERGERWIEDPDNQDESSRRVLLRRRVFPFLTESFDASLMQHLCRTADILREEDEWIEDETRMSLHRSQVGWENGDSILALGSFDWIALPLRRRILRAWLFDCGLGEFAGWDVVERILELYETESEWTMPLSPNIRLFYRGYELRVERSVSDPELPVIELPEEGSVVWGEWKITVRSLPASEARREAAELVRGGGYAAALSCSACGGKPLRVRSRMPGDRIAPTGFDGSRKVQDVLVDRKIPVRLRDRIPIMVCGETVAWFPGSRISRHFALREETEPALLIRAESSPAPTSAR